MRGGGATESQSFTKNQYCEFIEQKFKDDEVWAVYGDDIETNTTQENGKKHTEIRLILKKNKYVLLCSADEGGKALKCFRILENKSFDEIKDSHRAIKLNCSFKVGEKAPKDCDDAKQLRNFLKKASQSAQESTLQQEIPLKTFKATLDSKDFSTTLPRKEQQISGVAEAKEHMYAIINKIQSITSRYNEKLYEIEEGIERFRDIGFLQYYYETLGQIIQGIPNYSFSFGENEESFQFVDKEEFVKMSKKPLESFVKTIIVYDDILKKHCDVAFPPSITLYKEREITSKDLSVKPKENIAKSAFFQALNTILNRNKSKQEGIDIISRITKAIKMDYYEEIEKEINKHLQEVINKRFNELYCLEKEVYAFKIRLDSQEVLLYITKDKETIDLDKQSVGFRKFFNLYFNFLYTQKIGRGDIVCIDEPENSLSLPSQRDLRDFLRDFGRQSGILFIIATHSPSMIDINHLDKVRIVKPCSEISSDLKGSAFINNISALGYGESDVLKEIFSALGGQIDFDKSKVIFVEGIADYNILTAYARIYAQNNKNSVDSKELIFLPIGGLGADDKENQDSKSQKDSKQSKTKMSQEQREKVEHLLEFAKKCNILNPILLVDDDKAGRAMKEGVEADSKFKALSVLTLKEAFIEDNKEFKKDFEHLNKENLEIEQLFSSEDRERFGFDSYKENKQVSIISSSFKDEILEKLESKENKLELSEETKSNFNELFKYLIGFKESNNA